MNKQEEQSELFLKFLTNNLQHINNSNRINRLFAEDNLSINYLSALIDGYPYIPFSGSSLRPFCLNHIINDIVINNRKQIIEFGSGISTIFIGRLIKKNNLNATLLSVEHDPEWFKQLSKMLSKEKLEDVVKICYAPLKKCSLAVDENEWYDISIIDSVIENKLFDMVIIDGPPAWMKDKSRARYPAVPYMVDKLNKNYAIYLDDAIRQGEQAIIALWEQENTIKFNYSGSSLAHYYNGNSFYTEPYAYY